MRRPKHRSVCNLHKPTMIRFPSVDSAIAVQHGASACQLSICTVHVFAETIKAARLSSPVEMTSEEKRTI